MSKTLNIGLTIILGLAAIAGVIFYAVNVFSDLKKQELENLARFQCAQISRYTTTNPDGSEVWYPVEQVYKKCLEERKIK
ncbi:MAG: hypothetical protein AB1432_16195 [Bacteroidota bacterium]